MIDDVRQAIAALQKEDELALAFLYGRRMKFAKVLHEEKRPWNGVFFRILIFIRHILVSFNVRGKPSGVSGILFYASSNNQYQSLVTTYNSLIDDGVVATLLCGKQVTTRMILGYRPVSFNMSDLAAAIFLLLLRGPLLLKKLRQQGNTIAIRLHLNQFLYAYIYLPYFFRQLKNSGVKMAVVANDHNVENRCLRLVAEMLRIKTVYLQHASVSELFPPLQFDYAFLDGEESLIRYQQAISFSKQQGDYAGTYPVKVFLSGQKKGLLVGKRLAPVFTIGLALNQLDDINEVIRFIEQFSGSDIRFLVRPHPSQFPDTLQALAKYMNNSNKAVLCDAKSEGVHDFLARCHMLVAANSSIHLEAALLEVPTYYHEFNKSAHDVDYYGYVASGLAQRLPSDIYTYAVAQLEELSKALAANAPVIKRYSETYHSAWQNREGELVAKTIELLLENRDVSDLYHADKSSLGFQTVYRLPSN